MRADHYDGFAASYARTNETGLFNAHYARPAMIRLAGDVRGRRVLDAGCGSGPLAEDLRAGGAVVSGFDASPAMLELARERLGDDVDLRLADLGKPLPYADGEFDDVVVSLVLHYLQDWTGPLAELRRVLRPGGRLLLSVNHPRILESSDPDADYFSVTQYSEEYTFGDQQAVLTYWHRPLHAMSDAFNAAGFRISVISEPPIDPDTPSELRPPELESDRFICFLFFVLEAV